MFKKLPEIKNQVPLRSSDRRKLADQIIRDYQITIPDTGNDTSSSIQPTLSSLRNSLLPDSTSSARFTTSSGPDSTLVSGTVYIGAHPGQDKRILWFQSKTDPKLIPTVYTLWHAPDIVPLLHTPESVVEGNLRHGADLMIPGLVKAPNAKWDPRAGIGSIVAVAGTINDTVPLWIGFCQVDVPNLPDNVRGQKGVAVKALHWAGDECWRWRGLGSGGQEPPDRLEGWTGLTATSSAGVTQLSLGDKGDVSPNIVSPKAYGTTADEEEEREPSTKEVDEAFQQAFVYSIHKARANNPEPNFGFDLPILPSFLMSRMVQPFLRSQNQQYYTIKKTSWKNVKKFIKHLEKIHLVKSKDRNGGETVILDISFDNEQVVGFTPYKLPRPEVIATGGDNNGGHPLPSRDPSLGQKLTIHMVYRASPRLVPTLLPSKTEFYSAQQISAAIKSYVDQHPNVGGKGSSSLTLDPFLANNILGSKPSQDDNTILAAGRISRGALQKRVLDDIHLCQPYHIVMRDEAASDQKPKAGPPPQVHLTIEKRTGNKVVTKIANLEPFFVDPQLLAPELQKKCAGSASVGQASGSKAGLMEVVVQGDQRKMLIGDILPKRGIDAKWVDVIDKTKAKKK